MPETERIPQEISTTDTRDLKTFPFEIIWGIPSSEEKVIAQLSQFDALIESGIQDNWLTEDDIFALKLCFNEIIVNAGKHGNKKENGEGYDPDKNIRVEIRMDNETFAVSVQDESPVEFDPSKVPDPTAKENLLKTSGRGVMFMEKFFGKNAKFEFLDPGNKITLTRHKNI